MIMIDKCFGGKCPLKNSCYRFTSPRVSDVQNLIRPPFYVSYNNEFKCSLYWGDQTDILLYNLQRYFERVYENKT